jgi:hypothetical protein
MSKLVPRGCFLRGLYKGLFDFRLILTRLFAAT